MVYSKKGKLCDFLGNPKDKLESLEKSGNYQIKCEGFNAQYIDKRDAGLQPDSVNIFAT
jgi:hypothetical protein